MIMEVYHYHRRIGRNLVATDFVIVFIFIYINIYFNIGEPSGDIF